MKFAYRPLSVGIGMVISLIGIITSVALLLFLKESKAVLERHLVENVNQGQRTEFE